MVVEGIAPGQMATYSVILAKTGVLPIPMTNQIRIVAEGAIAPYVSIAQPKFPSVFKRGQKMTFNVTVSVPADAQAGTVEGTLLLKRILGKKYVEVWRTEALPVSIQVVLPTLPLNDTGITLCADATSNSLPCPVDGFPGQDAESGRDVTHNDDSDGHAGFSFTKLDENGHPLPASADHWSCVRDNVTGLVWEVKTDDGGLRDWESTYTWYNPDPTTNGGSAGTADGGSCTGSACDTDAFVQAVNDQRLCGASDWRLPDPRELLSIVHNDRFDPAIDTAWFPNTPSGWVWSSSPDVTYPHYAWGVGFDSGWVYFPDKSYFYYVRLVRTGQ